MKYISFFINYNVCIVLGSYISLNVYSDDMFQLIVYVVVICPHFSEHVSSILNISYDMILYYLACVWIFTIVRDFLKHWFSKRRSYISKFMCSLFYHIFTILGTFLDFWSTLCHITMFMIWHVCGFCSCVPYILTTIWSSNGNPSSIIFVVSSFWYIHHILLYNDYYFLYMLSLFSVFHNLQHSWNPNNNPLFHKSVISVILDHLIYSYGFYYII